MHRLADPAPPAIAERCMGPSQRLPGGAVSSSMPHVYVGSFSVDSARLITTHTKSDYGEGGVDTSTGKASSGRSEEEEERSIRAVYPEEMALGDDSPASYIRTVQHLIERCLTFGMSMEECMEALSKRADVQPVVTSTVWKELEKENKEFFDKYKQWRSEKGGVSSSSSS